MRVLPADTHTSVVLSCDGAARNNPGPAGIGVVVATEDGEVIEELADGIGVATNNVAEYSAAIAGLQLAGKHGARQVHLRSDSRLLIEQLAGRFKVKNPTLIRLHEEARGLIRRFDTVTFEHIPREENTEADRLANEGVDAWLAENGPYLPDPTSPSLLED